MDIDQIQEGVGVSLPSSYLQYLARLSGASEPSVRKELRCGDRLWRMASQGELLETITVHDAGEKPFHSCLELFLSLHLKFTGQRKVRSSLGNLPKERVLQGFVIGSDNGDYLYLDKADDYSVWAFCHDGCDVEKLNSSFQHILNANAVRLDDDKKAPATRRKWWKFWN